jgi:hypothetical protein
MREAAASDLNGLVSGGRPPVKLLQVSLNHTMFPNLRFEGFLFMCMQMQWIIMFVEVASYTYLILFVAEAIHLSG